MGIMGGAESGSHQSGRAWELLEEQAAGIMRGAESGNH